MLRHLASRLLESMCDLVINVVAMEALLSIWPLILSEALDPKFIGNVPTSHVGVLVVVVMIESDTPLSLIHGHIARRFGRQILVARVSHWFRHRHEISLPVRLHQF